MVQQIPEKLAISFWLWQYYTGTQKGDLFHDLEKCFVELKERGFNCIRVDSGAGFLHDTDGTPRGEVMLGEPFPGHSHLIREMATKGGRCDVLKKAVQLFELAKRHDVKVILSSWFYLHTFWFADDAIHKELLALPPERRFQYFAEENDRLIRLLKEKGLQTQIAFVEILNEADGLPFINKYNSVKLTEEERRKFRGLHEDALEFLRGRHPDILFAYDTYKADIDLELAPRNMQVWNLHCYYAWGVYGVLEGRLLYSDTDLSTSKELTAAKSYLKEPLVPLEEVRASRNNDPDTAEDWYRRIWLYRNVAPEKLPSLEKTLSENFERNLALYKENALKSILTAVEIRDRHFPGVPLVMGEAATYCAVQAMRWEERSDAYWELIEHTVGLLKSHGFQGCVPRTNSGPEDPVWTEFPERLRRVNQLFLAD